MQHLTDSLRVLAEHLSEEDAHLVMYAVNHIEASRVWKLRWAEADERLHRLQHIHEKLLREYNEYRKKHPVPFDS